MSEALKRARGELNAHSAAMSELANRVQALCPTARRRDVDEVLDALWLLEIDLLTPREEK
ncbi:MAG: hypothetical protein GY952_14035 [Rhodobacteraceae bacterium]|nr:hypothetical protein [Paracoccaceae bacterium]